MIQEQAAAAVITALISEKNKLRKKRKKKKYLCETCVKPWLKRRKNLEFYETLPAQLLLGDKYNYSNTNSNTNYF